MSYDPNWFYSSLAQSAAGLVGLLGAILASRLQEQYNKVLVTADAVAKLLQASQQDIRSKSSELSMFSGFIDGRIKAIESGLAKSATSITINNGQKLWQSSWTGGPQPLAINLDVLKEHQAQAAMIAPLRELIQECCSLSCIEDARSFASAADKILKDVPEMKDVLASWHARVATIDQSDLNHKRMAAIRVPMVMAAVLAWLCIVGLVAPLSYLSAFEGSSKGSLLNAFSVGVLVIPAYIGFELIRIFRLRHVRVSGA